MQPTTAGVNTDYKGNALTSAVPQVDPATQPTQPTQPKESGNFWSTVGGIALPILGALLAPETGGASLLASTALSGLGGGVGKAIDNSTAGEDPLQANVLTSGALNAGGNLAGGFLMKGLGKVAQGVVAPAAQKVGTSLVQGQGKGALDKATADYLFNNGVQDLKQVGKIAPIVTGKEGAFTNAVNNSLFNAADNGARIDLSSLAAQGKNLPGSTVLNAVRDAGIAGDAPSVNSVQKFVQGQLEKYNQGALSTIPTKGGKTITNFDNGVLNGQHPVDALNMTKEMDSTAAQWLQSRSPNIQAQGKALRNISNTIKDNLYGDGTAIGKTGITDQVRQQAIAELEPLKAINPQYYQTKVGELNNANTIAELRTAQRPDVMASQALNSADHIANVSGGANIPDLLKTGLPVGGFMAGGPVGAGAGLIASKVAGSEGASIAGAKTAAKLANVIGDPTAQKVMTTLGRIGGVTAANVPGMGAQPVQNSSILSSLPGGQTMQPGSVAPQSSISSILQMMQEHPFVYGSQLGSTLSSLAPQLQKNEALQGAIGGLNSQFANAGGAQGIGGIGSMLSSLMPGTAANAYQGSVDSVAAQLASVLGISTDAAKNLLPGLMQNEQTASQRQNVLGNLVSGLPS